MPNIQKVRLLGKSGKFILAEVGMRDNFVTVVRGHELQGRVEFHRDVLNWMRRSEPEIGAAAQPVQVLGGGRFLVDEEKQRIILSDRSSEFGKEDRSVTMRLLREAYPEFTVLDMP